MKHNRITLCLVMVTVIMLCAAVPTFAATDLIVEQDKPAQTPGLWILTPKVPRAVKYLAYTETRMYYGADEIDAVDYSWHMCVEDGDLDGPDIPEPPFYELTYNLVGQPFAYYDENLNPVNRFYFAVVGDGFSALRLDSVRILDEGEGSIGESRGEAYLKWEGGYYTPFTWVNTLALNPAITKENPLLLYQTEAGMGGITLDGSFACSVKINKGWVGDEVIHQTRQIHSKRKKTILEGEEVVRANRLITAEDLKNPYTTYIAVSKSRNSKLNEKLKDAVYNLGEFDFSELVFPKKVQRSFNAQKQITLNDGSCMVFVNIVGEEESAVEVMVRKDNYAVKNTVDPGDSVEDLAKWAQSELSLYAFKLSMMAQTEDSIGSSSFIDVERPSDVYLKYLLGAHYEKWKDKDDVYMIHKEVWAADSPVVYSLCAVAQYTQGSEQAEISVYAGYSSRQESIIQAKNDEPLPELLNRVRSASRSSLITD